MELSTKLYILDDEGRKFMGAGVLWLLERVEETGSLLSASRSMGLSYTKARSMLEALEENLGKPVLDRKKGGADRHGAKPCYGHSDLPVAPCIPRLPQPG